MRGSEIVVPRFHWPTKPCPLPAHRLSVGIRRERPFPRFNFCASIENIQRSDQIDDLWAEKRRVLYREFISLATKMETRTSPSIELLHYLAREVGLKHYDHLPKTELYYLLQRQCNVEQILQKRAVEEHMMLHSGLCQWNGQALPSPPQIITSVPTSSQRIKHIRGHPSQGKKAHSHDPPSQKMNTEDPIMLTPLGENTFVFTRPNGTRIRYNVESLVQYFLVTGDFHEPETRLAFSERDLKQLDAKNLNFPSVWEAKLKTDIYQVQKIKRDGLLGLERCASELITACLNDVVEADDPEEAEIQLITHIFPSFSDLYRQIQNNDAEYARQSMLHYVEWLKGPPNCPTYDEYGFLPIILSFLEQVAQGKGDASFFGFQH